MTGVVSAGMEYPCISAKEGTKPKVGLPDAEDHSRKATPAKGGNHALGMDVDEAEQAVARVAAALEQFGCAGSAGEEGQRTMRHPLSGDSDGRSGASSGSPMGSFSGLRDVGKGLALESLMVQTGSTSHESAVGHGCTLAPFAEQRVDADEKEANKFKAKCWDCRYGKFAKKKLAVKACREQHGHQGPDWDHDPRYLGPKAPTCDSGKRSGDEICEQKSCTDAQAQDGSAHEVRDLGEAMDVHQADEAKDEAAREVEEGGKDVETLCSRQELAKPVDYCQLNAVQDGAEAAIPEPSDEMEQAGTADEAADAFPPAEGQEQESSMEETYREAAPMPGSGGPFVKRCWDCLRGKFKRHKGSTKLCRETLKHTSPDWTEDPREAEYQVHGEERKTVQVAELNNEAPGKGLVTPSQAATAAADTTTPPARLWPPSQMPTDSSQGCSTMGAAALHSPVCAGPFLPFCMMPPVPFPPFFGPPGFTAAGPPFTTDARDACFLFPSPPLAFPMPMPSSKCWDCRRAKRSMDACRNQRGHREPDWQDDPRELMSKSVVHGGGAKGGQGQKGTDGEAKVMEGIVKESTKTDAGVDGVCAAGKGPDEHEAAAPAAKVSAEAEVPRLEVEQEAAPAISDADAAVREGVEGEEAAGCSEAGADAALEGRKAAGMGSVEGGAELRAGEEGAEVQGWAGGAWGGQGSEGGAGEGGQEAHVFAVPDTQAPVPAAPLADKTQGNKADAGQRPPVFKTKCWECSKGKFKQLKGSMTQCRTGKGHTEPDWCDDPRYTSTLAQGSAQHEAGARVNSMVPSYAQARICVEDEKRGDVATLEEKSSVACTREQEASAGAGVGSVAEVRDEGVRGAEEDDEKLLDILNRVAGAVSRNADEASVQLTDASAAHEAIESSGPPTEPSVQPADERAAKEGTSSSVAASETGAGRLQLRRKGKESVDSMSSQGKGADEHVKDNARVTRGAKPAKEVKVHDEYAKVYVTNGAGERKRGREALGDTRGEVAQERAMSKGRKLSKGRSEVQQVEQQVDSIDDSLAHDAAANVFAAGVLVTEGDAVVPALVTEGDAIVPAYDEAITNAAMTHTDELKELKEVAPQVDAQRGEDADAPADGVPNTEGHVLQIAGADAVQEGAAGTAAAERCHTIAEGGDSHVMGDVGGSSHMTRMSEGSDSSHVREDLDQDTAAVKEEAKQVISPKQPPAPVEGTPRSAAAKHAPPIIMKPCLRLRSSPRSINSTNALTSRDSAPDSPSKSASLGGGQGSPLRSHTQALSSSSDKTRGEAAHHQRQLFPKSRSPIGKAAVARRRSTVSAPPQSSSLSSLRATSRARTLLAKAGASTQQQESESEGEYEEVFEPGNPSPEKKRVHWKPSPVAVEWMEEASPPPATQTTIPALLEYNGVGTSACEGREEGGWAAGRCEGVREAVQHVDAEDFDAEVEADVEQVGEGDKTATHVDMVDDAAAAQDAQVQLSDGEQTSGFAEWHQAVLQEEGIGHGATSSSSGDQKERHRVEGDGDEDDVDLSGSADQSVEVEHVTVPDDQSVEVEHVTARDDQSVEVEHVTVPDAECNDDDGADSNGNVHQDISEGAATDSEGFESQVAAVNVHDGSNDGSVLDSEGVGLCGSTVDVVLTAVCTQIDDEETSSYARTHTNPEAPSGVEPSQRLFESDAQSEEQEGEGAEAAGKCMGSRGSLQEACASLDASCCQEIEKEGAKVGDVLMSADDSLSDASAASRGMREGAGGAGAMISSVPMTDSDKDNAMRRRYEQMQAKIQSNIPKEELQRLKRKQMHGMLNRTFKKPKI